MIIADDLGFDPDVGVWQDMGIDVDALRLGLGASCFFLGHTTEYGGVSF